MKKVDVVWFIEHTTRELDVACAATFYLTKHYNLTVEILPFHHKNIGLIPRLYCPKIVVIPYCYSVYDSGTSEILPKLMEPIYFNLYWEQILYKANVSYKAPHDVFARKYVLHHVWSKRNADYFNKKHKIPTNHMFINGQPAYKLYDAPYSNIYPSREDLANRFKLNNNRLWLFFPENFSWAFYTNDQLAQIVEFGQDEKTAFVMRDYCKKLFKETIKWFKEASVCPVEIILRPRPAISKDNLIKAVKEVISEIPGNLFITDELSIREWILRSDIVVSSFSTSLIEASIAHKPIYIVAPIKMPEPLWTDWYKYTPKLTSKNDFINVCNGRKNDNSGIKLNKWAKKEFLANEDPIKNLADYIYHILDLKKRPVPQITSEVIRYSSFSLSKQLLLNLIYRKVSGRLREIFFSNITFSIEESFQMEVKKRLENFGKILK